MTESFLTRGQEIVIPEGTVLFRDGQPYSPGYLDVSYILEGEVCYAKKDSQSKYVHVRFGPSGLIGSEGMYNGSYPVNAVASENTRLYQWPKDEFELLVGMDIEFAVKVVTSLSRHQRSINEQVMLGMTRSDGGGGDSLETLFEKGAGLFNKGQFGEAKQFFERILSEYPDNDRNAEIAEFLINIENELEAIEKAQEEEQAKTEQAFDVTNQDGVDADASIQYGLYNLAFQGKDSVSEDLYNKFGMQYKPGQLLFDEGDPGEELFIMLKGVVQVIKNEKILTNLKEGDIFGEMAIFENKPRSAAIKALTEVSVLSLTKDNFKMIFQLHPTWALQLISGFSMRITNCYQMLSKSE